MTYWLIDSPVTVFSDKADIEKWLKELDRMPESEQRDLAIKDATEMLEYVIARENTTKIPEINQLFYRCFASLKFMHCQTHKIQ